MDKHWTLERRERAFLNDWFLGATLYHEALVSAGIPAPGFEYEEEGHPGEDEPGKSDITIRLRLHDPSERIDHGGCAPNEAGRRVNTGRDAHGAQERR